MEEYKLSNNINSDKIFITRFSELAGRLDPYYYKPEFVKLEKQLNTISFKTFHDYISDISSGATPNKSESESYYTNRSDGVPFLRVQNIIGGELVLQDCIYINKNTHSTMLKRSQVHEDNLIVTITGRIASAAVAPKNFQGNTNQHSVVIKTANRKISEFLAAFLNSNIGQKLALRRAAGGTRPALDYKALFSIPIVYNEAVIDVMNNAYTQKKEKEAQAKALSANIADYLLKELGITLPKFNNSLKNRIFITNFSEISGKRWDSFAVFNINFKIDGGKFKNYNLNSLAHLTKGESITSDKIIEGMYPVVAGGQVSPYSHNTYNYGGNVITISASGAYAGYVWYHSNPIFASDCTVIYSRDEQCISTIFLYEILKLKQKEIYHLQQGAGQPHVYAKDLKNIQIPIPPMEKQKELSSNIQKIRNEAKKLQEEAQEILENAKKEVEFIILGKKKI